MLTHSQKADYYDKMYDLIEKGWTKGALSDFDGFCLVGAANAVTSGGEDIQFYHAKYPSKGSLELQRDMMNSLLSRNPTRMIRSGFGLRRAPDEGLVAVEVWNDKKWRTQDQVLKLIARRRAYHDKKAGVDRVALLEQQAAEYEKQISELRERISTIEAENSKLRDEVTFWKARRNKVTPKELTTVNKELAALDKELDATLLKVTRIKAAA